MLKQAYRFSWGCGNDRKRPKTGRYLFPRLTQRLSSALKATTCLASTTTLRTGKKQALCGMSAGLERSWSGLPATLIVSTTRFVRTKKLSRTERLVTTATATLGDTLQTLGVMR